MPLVVGRQFLAALKLFLRAFYGKHATKFAETVNAWFFSFI